MPRTVGTVHVLVRRGHEPYDQGGQGTGGEQSRKHRLFVSWRSRSGIVKVRPVEWEEEER